MCLEFLKGDTSTEERREAHMDNKEKNKAADNKAPENKAENSKLTDDDLTNVAGGLPDDFGSREPGDVLPIDILYKVAESAEDMLRSSEKK